MSRRGDHILETTEIALEALNSLAADYKAANMPCAAAELRRRAEHH